MFKIRLLLIICFFVAFSALMTGPVKGDDGGAHPSGKGVMKSMEGMKGKVMMEQGEEGAVSCMKGHMDMKEMQPLKKGPGFNEGKIILKSPKDGDVTKSTVKVEFEILDKGAGGNHVHIYVDGECKVMVRSGTSHTLSGLREGNHAIGVRLVTEKHQETGAQDWVVVNIKRKKP